jgi:DNA-binding transcriptional ArsR family regulator
MNKREASTDLLFRALADPTRRAIFQRLAQAGEQTVRTLTEGSGVSQPAVSKHLALLKQAALVEGRRKGRDVHYRARDEALAPLVDWLEHYAVFWRERFDRLEDLLNRMDR